MSAVNDVDDWIEASIVWVDAKSDKAGRAFKEVIYEIAGDSDNLRQVNVRADALYPGAKRGDRVLIQPGSMSIRRKDVSSGK